MKTKPKSKVKELPTATITDCTFNGVVFDKPTIEAIEIVAKGLLANAEGLAQLAKVFGQSHINLECMLKIG